LNIMLAIAHEKASFIGTVDRQYDDSFGQSGAKIGSTLRVRNPNKYTRRAGSRVMNIQDSVESTQTITLATQDGVDMQFNSAELALDTDNRDQVSAFSKRYVQPAMSVLLSNIESDFLAYATKATYNVAGTAGTAMTDLTVPGAARAKLNQGLAPKDERSIMMDSVTMGSLVNGSAAYFAPSNDIGEQYREGMIARRAMADFYENERIWTLTNGSDVTISTDAAALVVDGTGALDFHTLTAAQVTVGSVFTIAGVYACHPETKAAYRNLQQFTLVSGGATSGASVVSPAIYLTGPNQNVCSSTGAQLAATDFNSQVMTFVGAASTSYAQSLMYHKEAFQFVTADLPLMGDSLSCARKTQDGISLRVWQASDIINDRMLMRLDILYGFAALRPEWASRMIGAAG
jgi:hypothetical protein